MRHIRNINRIESLAVCIETNVVLSFLFYLMALHGKNGFVEVSKKINLNTSENNFRIYSNDYVGRSS